MRTYIITYAVGNTYKEKRIKANTVEEAVRKARLKSIVNIDILEYQVTDKYLLRDF